MTIPFKMFCWEKKNSKKNKWNAVNRFKSATKNTLTDVSICEHGFFMTVLCNLGYFQIRFLFFYPPLPSPGPPSPFFFPFPFLPPQPPFFFPLKYVL